jgi:hypothetical protein
MATDAQNEANRKNAIASTGPKTPEGKSTSSRNAVSHGLFAAHDTVQPNEQTEFAAQTVAMQHELAPEGALEQILAHEIIRAAWRLRRCAAVEDTLTELDPFTDPMANDATICTQNAVDRARLQTHRILTRSMAELRRLQSERQFRLEILPAAMDTTHLGLASYKELIAPMVAEKRWQLQKRKLEDSFEAATKQTQSAPLTATSKSVPTPITAPRNAPCPCGSGQKHKRCCGQNAPPVLHSAAA